MAKCRKNPCQRALLENGIGMLTSYPFLLPGLRNGLRPGLRAEHDTVRRRLQILVRVWLLDNLDIVVSVR